MVELAALEKRYGATHRGFESLSLRHISDTGNLQAEDACRFFITKNNVLALFLFFANSVKSNEKRTPRWCAHMFV